MLLETLLGDVCKAANPGAPNTYCQVDWLIPKSKIRKTADISFCDSAKTISLVCIWCVNNLKWTSVRILRQVFANLRCSQAAVEPNTHK